MPLLFQACILEQFKSISHSPRDAERNNEGNARVQTTNRIRFHFGIGLHNAALLMFLRSFRGERVEHNPRRTDPWSSAIAYLIWLQQLARCPSASSRRGRVFLNADHNAPPFPFHSTLLPPLTTPAITTQDHI